MTICRQEAINRGDKAIPRSCPTCKFGPCQKGLADHHTKTASTGSAHQLASEILKLNWTDMDSFAQAIVTAFEADNGDDNSPRFLAFHILEWARENAPR